MLRFALTVAAMLTAALPARAAETLTVLTYESFTAEWGPGPAIEKAFEAQCGCDLKWVSVGDVRERDELVRKLTEGGYSRVTLVEGKGTVLPDDAELVAVVGSQLREGGFNAAAEGALEIGEEHDGNEC